MKSKFFIFVLIVFTANILKAQNNIGLIWNCNTIAETKGSPIQKSNKVLVPVNYSPKIVNIFVHVLRMDNGTGGLTVDQVNNWITLLVNDYSPNNIFFQVIGQANLNNSQYYVNGITDQTFNTLINTDTNPNAIDIYLLSPNDTYSRASGIPGIAIAVGGNYVGTSVLSHELGHCLGLYHTHSGSGCNDILNCAENINGSNCITCGI